MDLLKPGIYQHYSGRKYRLIGTGWHSETLEEVVIYQALYNSNKFGPEAIWVRPRKMFLENIKNDNYSGPRFKFIGKNSN